jgi:hypothetical protein
VPYDHDLRFDTYVGNASDGGKIIRDYALCKGVIDYDFFLVADVTLTPHSHDTLAQPDPAHPDPIPYPILSTLYPIPYTLYPITPYPYLDPDP